MTPDFYGSIMEVRSRPRWGLGLAGAWMLRATSSCTRCATSGSDMDAVFEFMSRISGGDSSAMMVSAFVFLSAAALAFGLMAVVAGALRREAARGRRSRPARANATRRSALAALRQQGRGAAADRLHHQALFGREHRRDQGTAPPAASGRLPRSARAGLFFLARAVAAVVLALAAFLLDADAAARRKAACSGRSVLDRRHLRLFRAERLSEPPHRGAAGRASRRISGFHGSAGGVRRRRA